MYLHVFTKFHRIQIYELFGTPPQIFYRKNLSNYTYIIFIIFENRWNASITLNLYCNPNRITKPLKLIWIHRKRLNCWPMNALANFTPKTSKWRMYYSDYQIWAKPLNSSFVWNTILIWRWQMTVFYPVWGLFVPLWPSSANGHDLHGAATPVPPRGDTCHSLPLHGFTIYAASWFVANLLASVADLLISDRIREDNETQLYIWGWNTPSCH